MKIKFRYAWYDTAKTILHFTAEAAGNWRDWHAGWQPVVFSLINHDGNAHVLLDFREQTRDTMPAGINAHFMSFGTKISPKLSGKAVVLGLSADDQASLLLDDDGTLETKTGRMYFAENEAEAQQLFDSFA